jgi:hypothetical protein
MDHYYTRPCLTTNPPKKHLIRYLINSLIPQTVGIFNKDGLGAELVIRGYLFSLESQIQQIFSDQWFTIARVSRPLKLDEKNLTFKVGYFQRFSRTSFPNLNSNFFVGII